ncbi:MAG: Ig-like domain-containing protein [Alphaproteobacteria bacterium]
MRKSLLSGLVLATSLIGTAAQANDFHADVLVSNINVTSITGYQGAENTSYYFSNIDSNDVPTHVSMSTTCGASGGNLASTELQFRDSSDNTILRVIGCKISSQTHSPSLGSSPLEVEQIIPIPVGTVRLVAYADGAKGEGYSLATISVDILGEDVPTPTNTSPVANKDSGFTTTSGNSITVAPLLNDSDADGDLLTLVKVWKVDHGNSAVVNSDGTITFTAGASYVGSDYMYYEISDGNGGTDVSSVTVGVTAQ